MPLRLLASIAVASPRVVYVGIEPSHFARECMVVGTSIGVAAGGDDCLARLTTRAVSRVPAWEELNR